MNISFATRELVDLVEIANDNIAGGWAPPAAVPKRVKTEDVRTLTLTERRARNLPPAKAQKIGGGDYVNVLVEFADGVAMLAGQYPRRHDPADRSEAIISARARYLLIKSGGIRLDHRAKIPAVARVVELAPGAETEAARERCYHIRAALETFYFAPHWENGEPKSIAWVKLRRNMEPKLAAIAREHANKPLWWRIEKRNDK